MVASSAILSAESVLNPAEMSDWIRKRGRWLDKLTVILIRSENWTEVCSTESSKPRLLCLRVTSFRSDHHVVLCWAAECTIIWSPCGSVLTGGMHDDLITMWYCVDWWNARWSDQYVVLCWPVECTMIWSPCGTVLTGEMHDDLTTMWYCVDWWNARWSDHHVVLCWLVECTMFWLPCSTVLTGGMHDDLITTWYFVDWWNALWPVHHVVPCWAVECTMIWPPCWLVECTMIWPPCGTVLSGGMHDDLTTMWYCVERWNKRWFEAVSSIQSGKQWMQKLKSHPQAYQSLEFLPLKFPLSGELRTQKLKSHLVRTRSLNVLPLKPGVGQHLAIHATLTARNFFLAYFYPSSPFTCIFSKTSPDFFLRWLWLTPIPV